MSRTYKDRPFRIRNKDFNYEVYNEFHYDTELYEKEYYSTYHEKRMSYISSYRLERAGVKKKLKKRVDTEHRWMSTPMWWYHEYMEVPQRAKGKQWEKKVMKTPIEDLDLLGKPSVSRKPHLYYW